MEAHNVFSCLGASNYRSGDRAKHDLYTTPEIAVQALIDREPFDKEQIIYEPCVGMGHIAEVFKNKVNAQVITSDLIDYGYPLTFHKNFFDITKEEIESFINGKPFDIVTNPPYKDALGFIQHGLDIMSDSSRCFMLLRIQFLEGQKRGAFFKEHPPKKILVFTKRVSCLKNGVDKDCNSAVCFAWFMWEKNYKGQPSVEWLLN